ncbi:YiiX/YebB-like N1pC/P60 family cysteine hydrolase [Desmospora profundinema]|uniref:Uncharacterized protein YycO n=1 Tax=Desmospora profundinema TaxID=1571184 RepID=A0ABU1IHF0_9BACL|nr:YiiX/YebB-like N1pC/P60 family cysteine hydrolase [Desmospora profundinema]MDR6224207.1 uncharacterized protein YycO [Desmospora profundinema]
MRAMKLLCLIALVFSLFFVGENFTFASDEEEITLTPEQQKEVEEAKKRTQEVLQNSDDEIDTEEVEKIAKLKGVSSDIYSQDNSTSAVGTYGDILVTLSTSSSDSSAWAGGHAGVVSEVSGYVVEIFGNRGKLNGVRHWKNNWNTRYSHVRGLYVKGASGSEYSYAASYARNKIGKSYNYNFFNKKTTKRFYCSQLAWRAWYNKGYDLDNGGAVWPVNLIDSSKTGVFYKKG